MEPRSLASLQRLYQQESSLERRLVLMTILKQSPASTLKEAVRYQIVIVELQKWLLAAAESKDFRLAYRVIETLDKLPIDLTALQVIFLEHRTQHWTCDVRLPCLTHGLSLSLYHLLHLPVHRH